MLALNINPVQKRATELRACTPEKEFKTVALVWHKSNGKWSQNTADHLLLLTGDRHIVTQRVAQQTGTGELATKALPAEKLRQVHRR